MAFSWAGDLTGRTMPVVRNFQVAADCYVGQILQADQATSAGVKPSANAAAGPDTAMKILGICIGVSTSPTYDATYKGDKATYDTTQATLIANDPIGATYAQVALITPTTLIHAPIVKDTVGTNPECKAATTGSSDGLTFVIASIDTTVSLYSSAYCRDGANAGKYRKITTGAVATQTVVVPFTYDIAVGDTFCVANVVDGLAHLAWDTQIQGIDSSAALSNYFKAYVHELNLQVAGKEYAVFTLSSDHLAIGMG
jgi:hypothetical protein